MISDAGEHFVKKESIFLSFAHFDFLTDWLLNSSISLYLLTYIHNPKLVGLVNPNPM